MSIAAATSGATQTSSTLGTHAILLAAYFMLHISSRNGQGPRSRGGGATIRQAPAQEELYKQSMKGAVVNSEDDVTLF